MEKNEILSRETGKTKDIFTMNIPKSHVLLGITCEKWKEFGVESKFFIRILPLIKDKNDTVHAKSECSIHFYSSRSISDKEDMEVWKSLSEIDKNTHVPEWFWCATKISQHGKGILPPLLLWDRLKVGNLSLKDRILSYLDTNRDTYTPHHDPSTKKVIKTLHTLLHHYARVVELKYHYE